MDVYKNPNLFKLKVGKTYLDRSSREWDIIDYDAQQNRFFGVLKECLHLMGTELLPGEELPQWFRESGHWTIEKPRGKPYFESELDLLRESA